MILNLNVLKSSILSDILTRLLHLHQSIDFPHPIYLHSVQEVRTIKQIHARANIRNQLLYANDSGYPVIKGDITSEILKYKKEVFLLIWILVMIDMYPAHQLLASQALAELLKILEIVPSETEDD